jgi:Flp pilus assembly protein TadG
MMVRRKLPRDESGVAAIEMAFALPILIVMIWMFVQLAQVYRAVAGIQQGLGEGARYATLCLDPSATGCDIPAPADVQSRIQSAVYGIGPGTFDTPLPVCTDDTADGGSYYDLTVTYSQPTNLLLFPGPDITVNRSKRVWVATSSCPAS